MKATLLALLMVTICGLPSVCLADSNEISTARLERAVSKPGSIWERFYKFTVFIQNGKLERLTYQNLELNDLHYQFLQTLPEFKDLTRDQIDELTYRSAEKRIAYTGALIIHAGDDGVFRSRFSLAMQDTPTAKAVIEIAELIRKSGSKNSFGTALEFETLPHQEKGFSSQIAELTGAGMGLYTDRDDPNSIAYTNGWNVGRLEIVNNQAELDAKVKAGQIGTETIIYAREALREMPTVAGVISAVKLTPASHAVLLAQMYGAPVTYFKNAEAQFKDKGGQTVFLNANADPSLPGSRRWAEVVFNPSASDLRLLGELKVVPKLTFPYDPAPTEFRRVETLTRSDIGAYGGKASQAGTLLRQIPDNSIGTAFAIPLSLYARFINQAKASNGQTLRAYIDGKLNSFGNGSVSDATLEKVTAEIRAEIVKAMISPQDIAALQSLLDANFLNSEEKLRIRSSSNVEDGSEFNGAGLYDSVGFWLRGKKKDNLAKKLKELFASVYNKRAYQARRRFQIDESRVGMDGLIHRAFRNEAGNGVVRMTSPDGRYTRFEIVTLPGEDEQVTHAENEVSAEVISGGAEYLRVDQPYQGYSKQRTLFPSYVYLEITRLMGEVAKEYTEAGKVLDVESEFKILPVADGKYEVRIKQVRPVPHPTASKTSDGSTFVILGGKVNMSTSFDDNNTNAFADLWMPTKIQFDIDSITEAQLRGKKVTVHNLTYAMFGQVFNVAAPEVSVELRDGEYPGYTIYVALKNPSLPSLQLAISGSLGGKVVTHSVFSPEVYLRTSAGTSRIQILKATGDSSIDGFYTVSSADSAPQPIRTGVPGTVVIISGTRASGRISIVGHDTLFFGEGDGRSIRIGNAEIKGIWKRTINVPSSSIGYAANHHQGDESFVFDLFADTTLTPTERKELNASNGRYLYLAASSNGEEEDEAGAPSLTPEMMFIKENGRTKKLGTWRQRSIKGGRCGQLLLGATFRTL